MSFALVIAACGSYAAGVVAGGSEVYPKRDRMVDSAMIFTEADLKTIGWKTQKDFLLDYPESTVFKWGLLNQTGVDEGSPLGSRCFTHGVCLLSNLSIRLWNSPIAVDIR